VLAPNRNSISVAVNPISDHEKRARTIVKLLIFPEPLAGLEPATC
jgi:hypothetical protein